MTLDWLSLVSLFTFGFSSLFPLVNPIGTALIISPFFAQSTHADRRSHAFAICFYAMILGLCAIVLGSWVLHLMGISIATTQLGGGLIIAHMGLGMLNPEADKTAPSFGPKNIKDSLFYPLTFPLTLGPGCLSVLIALSAHAHTSDVSETLLRKGVLCVSLLAVMIVTYFCFLYSEVVIRRVGSQGSLVLNRLMAFLVFCIGLQMAINGLSHSFPLLFR